MNMKRSLRIFAKSAEAPVASGRSWYRVAAKKAEGETPASTEVLIYDEIGLWGITAARLIEDFKAIDDGTSPVTVAINSPGGDVFDGIALNAWVQRLGARATVRIDGLAASAASVIAAGGQQVCIAESAMMMIHNPWTLAYGEAADLRKTADMMDKVRDSILAAYRRKAAAIDDAELVRMLDEETWLTAEEAVALGLADVIAERANARACHGSTGLALRFRHPPKALLAETDEKQESPDDKPADDPAKTDPPPAPESVPEPAALARAAARIIQACLKAGLPELSEELIMKTKLTDEAAVTAETGRIQAIRDLCASARLPELSADYIRAGLSADAVRARLFDKIAQATGDEIDNKEPAGNKPKTKALNPSSIYAARRGKKGAKQ